MAQLHELQAELAVRGAQVGAGEDEQLGAAALQQAALTALVGREECVVRLRLMPGGLATGGLGLVVVVHDPDEDLAQDVEEAEPLVPPAAAPGRGYKLMSETRHIMVNAMVFLSGLQFEGMQPG